MSIPDDRTDFLSHSYFSFFIRVVWSFFVGVKGRWWKITGKWTIFLGKFVGDFVQSPISGDVNKEGGGGIPPTASYR